MGYVTFTILGAVFETKHVDVETLQAALCVYLLVGLIWAYLYDLIELAAPGSFRSQGAPMIAWSDDPSRRSEFLRLLILSYSKLTSSGSEDLAPATGFARISVCLEALSGQVYLAVVIARLVGMQADHPPNGHKHGQETRIGDESVTGPIPSDGGFS
jgi:hypothetical protein